MLKTLFSKEIFRNDIKTQGIKYTGSKRNIIPVLLGLIKPLNIKTVLDGFSGTTRVSQALKRAGYVVYSNDIAVWSKIFGQCYLLNKKPANYYLPIINRLNKLSGKYGWFSKNYGGKPNKGSSVQKDGKKRIWQLHNTIKLDAIREKIEKISKNEIEKSVLLTSLILAMDKVDNSVGHQVSYLKKWAPRAYNTMEMKVPDLIIDDKPHCVYEEDIFNLIKSIIKVDLAYYDPPYGSSNELMPPSRVRYASYYHLWKTICLNDKPKLVGVSNRREDCSDNNFPSIFEEYRKDENGEYIVIKALEKLIKNTPAKYIVLSYNNNGRANLEAIINIFKKLKKDFYTVEMDYKKNVMATITRTNNKWVNNKNGKNKEYLFLISNNGKIRNLPGTRKVNLYNSKSD